MHEKIPDVIVRFSTFETREIEKNYKRGKQERETTANSTKIKRKSGEPIFVQKKREEEDEREEERKKDERDVAREERTVEERRRRMPTRATALTIP